MVSRTTLSRVLSVCAAIVLSLAPWSFAAADSSGQTTPFPLPSDAHAFHREDRDHISIIEFSGNYDKNLPDGKPNSGPRAVVSREFFRTHPDNYDFLVVFTSFEFPTPGALAFYNPVQNSIQGIGETSFNLTSLYGSKGKLQGFIDMAALTRYSTDPLDPQFEIPLRTLSHEVLHRWASFVKIKLPDGTLSEALLGKDGAHWSYLLDTGGSVQYGADWKDNSNGTFTSNTVRTFYSPLDLYLMGFYKPEEVAPFFVIQNPAIDKTQVNEENVTIGGTKQAVTVNDIIAAEGARVPAADQAQKDFRIGFVLLTGVNEAVSDQQVAALNNIRNAFMTRFSIMTGGRGIAQVYPEAMPLVSEGTPTIVNGGEIRTTPSSVDDGLAWLRSRQAAAGYWADKDTTTVRDTTVATGTLATLDGSFAGTNAALQWLTDHPSTNTDYLARHSRLLTELNGNATPIRTQLVGLQNTDGGWGVAAGYQSDPLDTALAVLA
ncbi:MAG TPA: hypothetical protein VMS40_11960, partial [Vicinamibacterales bacterium]|nr:hypothetical protein [Vicinamibacterales bacterium]